MTDNKRSRYSGFWESIFILTGDHTDALLFNYLLYQTQYRDDLAEILEEETTQADDEEKSFDIGWIKKTATEIAQEAMIKASKQTVRRRIEGMVTRGLVIEGEDRADPMRVQKMYRVNITETRKQLAALGYTLQGYERIDDLFTAKEEAEETEAQLRDQITELQNLLREFQNGTREFQDLPIPFQNGTGSIYIKDIDSLEDSISGANAPLDADASDPTDLQPPLLDNSDTDNEDDPPTTGIKDGNERGDNKSKQPRVVTTRNEDAEPKTRKGKGRKLYPEEVDGQVIKDWQQALARMLSGDATKEYWYCSAKLKAQIDRVGAALLKCDPPYTVDELTRWHDEVWCQEWPGQQRDGSYQKPRSDEVQDGIGRIRSPLVNQRINLQVGTGDPNQPITLTEGLTMRLGDVQKTFADWTEHLKHSKQPLPQGANFATPAFVEFVQSRVNRSDTKRATVEAIKAGRV